MVATGSRYRQIVCDPRIQGGEPVIRGTRVPIRSVVLSLRDDYPGDLSAVAEAYRISRDAVEAAQAYYGEHRTEIDQVIALHEQATRDC